MKKFLLLAAVLLAVTPMGARAAEKAKGTPSIHASSKETATLKIVAIDKTSRVVTLTSAAGDTVDVKCGPEVHNFSQLAVGDEVVTTYKESFTLHVEKAGEPEDVSATSTERAAVGAKPGAAVYETRKVSAKVTAIDQAKGTVTLQTASGEKFTVKPASAANLKSLEVGNTVVATSTTASAISVNKPKPAGATTSKSKKK